MAKWQWAALWKKAAKQQRWYYHFARDMLWRWKLQYWEKFKWAKVWKRAAKNYRAMFKLCALTSVPLWKERYWASQRSARAWKRAAKRWRKRAFLLASDDNSQRAIASQVPYLKERVKDLEGQIPARTFDVEDYLHD